MKRAMCVPRSSKQKQNKKQTTHIKKLEINLQNKKNNHAKHTKTIQNQKTNIKT